MQIKQNNPSLPRNLTLETFSKIPIVFSKKGKSATPPLFQNPEVLLSASDKAKLFAQNFFKNYNLYDSGISLPVFPSRTNLKLHISVTCKMLKMDTLSKCSQLKSFP